MAGLIYTPVGWVPETTKLSADNFNQMEAGIVQATDQINGLTPWTDMDRAVTTNVTVANPGTTTFDGLPCTPGDRILLAGQTTQTENGLYDFNGAAVPMTRCNDAAASKDFVKFRRVYVKNGRINRFTTWELYVGNVVLGTNALLFRPFAMRPSRVLIREIVLAAAGTIDFTNIPQDFTHLEIEMNAQSTRAATNTGLRFALNNDRAARYHIAGRVTYAGGGFANGDIAQVNDTWGYAGQIGAGNSGIALSGEASIRLPFYSRLIQPPGGSGGDYRTVHALASWSNVFGVSATWASTFYYGPGPTTQITFNDDVAGGLIAGSHARLYGIVD